MDPTMRSSPDDRFNERDIGCLIGLVASINPDDEITITEGDYTVAELKAMIWRCKRGPAMRRKARTVVIQARTSQA